MDKICKFVKQTRVDLGLTQEEVAELLDVSRNYVSLIERGERAPSWRYLLAFAGLLHVPVQDLLRAAGLVGEPPVPEADVAAFVAANPQFADVFDVLREHPDMIPEILNYARYLLAGAPERRARERDADVAAGSSGFPAAEHSL